MVYVRKNCEAILGTDIAGCLFFMNTHFFIKAPQVTSSKMEESVKNQRFFTFYLGSITSKACDMQEV